MVHSRSLILCQACILASSALPALAAEPAWHKVASVDPNKVDSLAYASGAAVYQYPAGLIPDLGAQARTILFGDMTFTFPGVKASADYQLRASFLSDSADRIEKIQINASTVDEHFVLPSRKITNVTWHVASRDTNLTVVITKVAGPNAVIGSLELWSTVPGALKAPQPLSERLMAIAVPPPRLSPRPTAVIGLYQSRLDLNGKWHFNPKLPAEPEQISQPVASKWKSIAVPGEWVTQGFTVAPDDFACYWREFDVPAEWENRQLKLRFDTVHSECKVWVNGCPVGAHEGCFVPFELDISTAARPGKNTLTVAVRNESLSDRLASATYYAGHSLGGITRKVVLFALPRVNLAAQSVTTRFDTNYRNATLTVHFEIANESTADANSEVAFELTDPHGNPVLINPVSPAHAEPLRSGIRAIRAGATLTQDVAIAVSAPAQWDTEHPNLYTLRTELRTGGHDWEVITQRVGFRQIEIRGNRVFVNNRPIKVHGVCRHESHPLFGRSLTPELWRKDAEMFRAANVNYIRTSHYPPPEEFLDLCDELGLFVECEAPLCWVNHPANSIWSEWNYLDTKFFPSLARANLTSVTANRNHPSIIVWSLANESAWSPLFADVLRRVKQLDPSRPTSFHDQSWGNITPGGSTCDIANFHYPDTNGPAACDGGARPVLFGEYCHLQTYNHDEGLTDPGVRDQWGPRFADMFDSMYRHDGNFGGAIWSGIDDAFHLPDGQVEGYGFWGVIDGWRRAKPETFHVKKAYSPIRVITRELAPGAGPFTIALENRYNFADLSEVKIQWSLGRSHGNVTNSIPPRGAGEIKVAAGQIGKAGQALRLQFTDPRGFVCDEVELPIGKPKVIAARPLKGGMLDLQTNDANVVVAGSKFSCEIDRRTGQIKNAVVDGRPVLAGGPVLMALPIEEGPCKPQDLMQFGFSNETCSNWNAKVVSASRDSDGSVMVRCEGGYADYSGGWSMRFDTNGAITVDYDFVVAKDLNPRQAGLVFYIDRKCDTLRWQRIAPWSGYPETHIGRPEGSAKANPNAARHTVHRDRAPAVPWSFDSTALGTADFRSTKANVVFAELDGPGRGVAVASEGTESARAFVDGARIGWLIASIDTGGGEPFFRPHSAVDRRPLKAGDHIKDVIHLQLTKPRSPE